MVGRGRLFYGVAGHDDPEHRGAGSPAGARGRTAEHEVSAGQLYLEPGGLHSDQRLDRAGERLIR